MRLPSITAGLAKMESKLAGTGGPNDYETGSTISNHDLLATRYGKPEPTAMMVARLITRTMLLITLIVSLLVLVSVYIQARSNHLVCDYGVGKESRPGPYFEPLTAESGDMGPPVGPGGRRIPISIRMSGRAGDLMSGGPDGKPGQVNCLIERKTANQIIASEPKKLITPYGNITTDPRLIHLTGEKLIFSCHSGDKEDKDDKEREVIIISNSKESIDPSKESAGSEETEKESASEAPEKEKSVNMIKNRKRRAVPNPFESGLKKKECTCSCAC